MPFETAIICDLAQEQIPLDRKSRALVTGNYRLLAAERLLPGLESDARHLWSFLRLIHVSQQQESGWVKTATPKLKDLKGFADLLPRHGISIADHSSQAQVSSPDKAVTCQFPQRKKVPGCPGQQ